MEKPDDGLVKRYGTEEKNVAQQVHRAIDKVREKFNWLNGKNRRLVVDYLIYCPDYQIVQVNAAGLNAERVVDAVAKDGLAKRIEKILGSGKMTRDGWYEKVEDFFYQTFDSVYRFKGQEASAVILVDIDPDTEQLTHAERLLYCGMTRATIRLELVVNSENNYNSRFLGGCRT